MGGDPHHARPGMRRPRRAPPRGPRPQRRRSRGLGGAAAAPGGEQGGEAPAVFEAELGGARLAAAGGGRAGREPPSLISSRGRRAARRGTRAPGAPQ